MKSSHKSRYKGKKPKKSLTFLLYFILFIFILSGAFFITYNFFTENSYSAFKDNIESQIYIITETNQSVESLLDSSNQLMIEDARNSLPKIRDSLLEVQSTLESLSPPNEFKSSYNHLKKGLYYNIELIKEIIYVLDEKSVNSLESSLNNIISHKANCSNKYLLVKFDSLNIFLPKEFIEFIDSTIEYTEDAIEEHKSSLAIKEKHSQYISSINNTFSSFKTIYDKRDSYSREKNSSRMSKKKYENLIEKLKDDSDSLSEVVDSFETITPPEGTEEIHKTLQSLLTKYNSYLSEYLSSLESEKALFEKRKLKDEDKITLYKNSTDILKNTSEIYDSFLLQLSKFK